MNGIYDKTIGYSPLQDVDRLKLYDLIRVNQLIIDKYFFGKRDDRILVAGAGLGDEAEIIFELFKLRTIGVDIHIANSNTTIRGKDFSLSRQDLSHLAFADNSFSLIYCYHVLEHVLDHMEVLRELRRVMLPGGVMFIGFPNKRRLVSYIGTSQKVSIIEKVKWNLNDYVYRLNGRFENKYGAHAGFSEKEFLLEASGVFSAIHPVRNEYMKTKYNRVKHLIWFVTSIKLGEILFPSNYYICVK